MNVKITPFKAEGAIVAPPSKSYAHRYIIAAFLSGKPCTIENVGCSDDVKATVSAVKSLGGDVTFCGGNVIVNGAKTVKQAVVNCGESGSTMRFLIPVAAALGVSAEFVGNGRLSERPVDDLANAMEGHGAVLCGHSVSGKLKSGKYVLDASLSSQFVTGMLFALSVSDGESEITLTGKRVSAGYIDITVDVLRRFGVSVTQTENGYKIVGGYGNTPEKVSVEGDWSGAAFPLAMGALGGRVTVGNLVYPTLQADGKILDFLRAFGAQISVKEGSVTVSGGKLNSVKSIDCENCPDIAQVLCSVAAFAEGVTTLVGTERLKIKESDRVNAIINTLNSCGVQAESDGKTVTVYGGKPKGGVFSGGKDHRTVMSAAVIASAAEGVSEIAGAEYFTKSYPEFFDDIKKLGGKVDVRL